MNLEELKTKVSAYFAGKPVKRVYVFGSFLEKGDAANDIDLIAEFDYEEAPKFDLLDHIGYALDLQDQFGKKVDLLSYTAIKPKFFEMIRPQMKQVFERSNELKI